MRAIDFATRDTPEALRRALADAAAKTAEALPPGAEQEVRRGGGLFAWPRRG